jgi:hypothetical protein
VGTAVPLAVILFAMPGLRAETKPEIRDLVRQALAGFNKEDERLDQYGYVQRWRRSEFNGDGSVHSKRSGAWRRGREHGYWIGRSFERDGKPLTADEIARQEEAVRTFIAERKADAAAGKKPAPKKPSEEDAWIQEFPDALDYQPAGEEMIHGRPALVLAISPRPGYQPRSMRARLFEKMRGKMWIDQADHEMTKADVEMFDTVSLGFGLVGRIEKGTRFHLERQRVGPGTWLMSAQSMRFDARIMLFKTMRRESSWERSEFASRAELERAASREGK